MFKKHISIIFLLLIPFLLFKGCYFKKSEKPKLYAYISKEKQGQSFHDSIVNGLKKTMATKNVLVDFLYAENQKDIESQKKFIAQIIKSKKYDGVLICPNSSLMLNEDLALLDNHNIPFIVIDTMLEETKETKIFKNYCGYVGTNNFTVGKTAFDYISSKIKKGNILLVRGIQTHKSSSDREEGFINAIDKKPEFKIVGKITGDWKTDNAFLSFKNFVKNNKQKIDAVFAYNDHMALGISRYYEEEKVKTRPIIIGVDATVLGQKGLLDRKIDAIVVQATELMGIDALNKLIECSKLNKKIPANYYTPTTLLTTTNALERINE